MEKSAKLDIINYVKAAVLYIINWFMYLFHYEISKPKYKENIFITYKFTDSIVYYIKA